MKTNIKSLVLVLTGSIYGFILFVPSICSATSYPQTTTTALTVDLSMNQYKLNDAGDIITKGPWVDARAYNSGAFNDVTISAALTAIGTNQKTLLLAPGTWTISANVTVPSNVNLRFEQGANLSIGSAYTFTINGPIEAPIVKIFSSGTGSGAAKFGVGYVKEVYPQWWGAKGDGTTDDTAAIQAAIDSGCKRIYFLRPANSYAFTGLTIAAGTSNLSLIGQEASGQTAAGVDLKYTPTTGDGITLAGEADFFVMKNLDIYTPGSTGTGIYGNNSTLYPLRNFVFEDVRIGGFKSGINLPAFQNGLIQRGEYGGQGKSVTGGVGIQVGGDDSSHIGDRIRIKDVLVNSFEKGIWVKWASPTYIVNPILEYNQIALDNDKKTYLLNPYFNNGGVPGVTSIDNSYSGAYLYVEYMAHPDIVTTNHRFFAVPDAPSRIDAYRSGYQFFASATNTKIQFNGLTEDTEDEYDETTNYRWTSPINGYYLVTVNLMWDSRAPSKLYKAMIYKNGTSIAEAIDYSPGTATDLEATLLTVSVTKLVWLDKGDYIEGYARHEEGQTAGVYGGATNTYMIISKQ